MAQQKYFITDILFFRRPMELAPGEYPDVSLNAIREAWKFVQPRVLAANSKVSSVVATDLAEAKQMLGSRMIRIGHRLAGSIEALKGNDFEEMMVGMQGFLCSEGKCRGDIVINPLKYMEWPEPKFDFSIWQECHNGYIHRQGITFDEIMADETMMRKRAVGRLEGELDLTKTSVKTLSKKFGRLSGRLFRVAKGLQVSAVPQSFTLVCELLTVCLYSCGMPCSFRTAILSGIS